MNTAAAVVGSRTTTYFFYSRPPIITISSSHNSTIYSHLSSYTIYDGRLTHYNLDSDDSDGLPDKAYGNEEWMKEFERISAGS